MAENFIYKDFKDIHTFKLPELTLDLSKLYNPPRIKKVIVNKKVTIVLWNDGTKTRSTCSLEDTFDPAIGIGQCLLKKVYGKRKINSLVKKIEYQHAPKAETDEIPF